MCGAGRITSGAGLRAVHFGKSILWGLLIAVICMAAGVVVVLLTGDGGWAGGDPSQDATDDRAELDVEHEVAAPIGLCEHVFNERAVTVRDRAGQLVWADDDEVMRCDECRRILIRIR